MPSEIKCRKSADITDTVHIHSDVPNELHKFGCTRCQTEPENQRGEQNTAHLDKECQHVELEHRLEFGKHFGMVGAVFPMSRHIMSVDDYLLHGNIGIENAVFRNDETSRCGDGDGEKSEPPEQILSKNLSVEEQRIFENTERENHSDKCARNKHHSAPDQREDTSGELLNVVSGMDIALVDTALKDVREFVEFAEFPQCERSPFSEANIGGRFAEFRSVSEEKEDEKEAEDEGREDEIEETELDTATP